MNIWFSLFLFIIATLASYLGTFVSGGTWSLSVGAMIVLGIPPQIAKATYQIWLFGWAIAGIRNFFESGHIKKRYLFGSVVATFIWAYIGATMMTYTPNDILQKITWWVFLLYLTIIYFRKKKKFKEEIAIKVTALRKNLTYFGQFFLSILSGYIPGASGPLYFILYSELLYIDILEYKALGRITGIAFSLGTLYPIIHAGLVNFWYIVPFFLGMYLWGHLGSKHLIHMGNTFAEYIVYSSVFLLALYLIFT